MSSGFIILRHVNSKLTNTYWKECYYSIRKFYPENKILIVDDNSSDIFLTEDINLYNTTIIKSEYQGRGELLPYFYYLNNKLFDTAVIIHDSIFINNYLNLKVKNFRFLWKFNNNICPQKEDEINLIKTLNNNSDLLKFYNKREWYGCFGGMVIINHNYLKYIDSIYNIGNLLDSIKTRYNRCSFERVIGCILLSLYNDFDTNQSSKYYMIKQNILYSILNFKKKSDIHNLRKINFLLEKIKEKERLAIFGDINLFLEKNNMEWGFKYEDYQKEKMYKNCPIIKVFTGR